MAQKREEGKGKYCGLSEEHIPYVMETANYRDVTDKTIREMFPLISEDEVVGRLKQDYRQFMRYQSFPEPLRQLFMEFMTGKKTLPLIYDAFFKKIFEPEIYPERLEGLISSIIGERVKIRKVLPVTECMLAEDTLLVMDIVVEMEDGSIANVEIQKLPYRFQGGRLSCYSSDLMMRQYSRLKGEKGKEFSYKDMHKVYTIVLYEKSEEAFKDATLGGKYLHKGKVRFDTGLKVELLQEFYLVALDVFRKSKYARDKNEQNAWLSLLTAATVEDLERLVVDYPWMLEICYNISEYLHKTEEVLDMFSEALHMLDSNTVQYMIDELQEKIVRQKEELASRDKELAQEKAVNRKKDEELAQEKAVNREKDKELASKDKRIAELEVMLRMESKE